MFALFCCKFVENRFFVQILEIPDYNIWKSQYLDISWHDVDGENDILRMFPIFSNIEWKKMDLIAGGGW